MPSLGSNASKKQHFSPLDLALVKILARELVLAAHSRFEEDGLCAMDKSLPT